MSETPSHIEIVYGELLHYYRRFIISDDKTNADKVDAAIILFEQLWPDDCQRWRQRVGGKD